MDFDRSQCLVLLATASIGRVVFTEMALPAAQPVSYFLDDQEIIFRTRGGSILTAAENRSVVAFQADAFDDATQAGWSVCGIGQAREVVDPERLAELTRLAPESWAHEDPAHTLSIPLQRITGRRVVMKGGIS